MQHAGPPRHAPRRESRGVELLAVALTLVLSVRRPAKRVLRRISTGSMVTGIFVFGLAAFAGRPDVAVGIGAGIAVFVLLAAILAPQEV